MIINFNWHESFEILSFELVNTVNMKVEDSTKFISDEYFVIISEHI